MAYKIIVQSVLCNHGARDLTTTIVEFDTREQAVRACETINGREPDSFSFGYVERVAFPLN